MTLETRKRETAGARKPPHAERPTRPAAAGRRAERVLSLVRNGVVVAGAGVAYVGLEGLVPGLGKVWIGAAMVAAGLYGMRRK